MKIRLAQIEELDRIMEIYAIAREFMVKNGNEKQWAEKNWPPKELIIQDVKNKKCYVCEEDSKIIAVFYYDFGHKIERPYNIIKGEWQGSDNYGVVHRIATDNTVKGTGSFCLNWAVDMCKNLRIDTHGDNIVMQKTLQKNNFRYAGIIYVEEDNYPRLAYEKQK